jgi:hypothetical protein
LFKVDVVLKTSALLDHSTVGWSDKNCRDSPEL